VRPSHLFAGSFQDNMDDMVMKGRSPLGERNVGSMLTEDLVRAMRADLASGMGNKEAARRYGISRSAVYLIKARRRWGHLT
jgi:DNA invertase Pin-like site-specific DNA recombinase